MILALVLVVTAVTLFALVGLATWRFNRGETPPALFSLSWTIYMSRNGILRTYATIYGGAGNIPDNTDLYTFLVQDWVYIASTLFCGVATFNLLRFYFVLRADPINAKSDQIRQVVPRDEYRRLWRPRRWW